MTHRLDDIDRRIIHALMGDARNTSAPMIAEGVNASAGTIRNRIDRLEEEGVIQGYTATVDFEQAGGRLTSMYMCTVPAADRERLALAAQSIPGVINVRILMAGRRDLHVVAVGEDTEDLREIARSLSELDIRIEDEELLQTEIRSQYEPFGPDSTEEGTATDIVTLADGADVIEVAASVDAPVVGRSLRDARDEEILSEDPVLVSIERDGEILQPEDDVVIRAGDIVTILPRESSKGEMIQVFTGENSAD